VGILDILNLYDVTPCFYCGLPATGVDHVLPQSLSDRSEWIPHRIRRFRWLIVPACQQCNSALGDRIFDTMQERIRSAKAHIRKKYAKYLSIPEWSDDQLHGLGQRMRQFVEAGIFKKQLTEERLRWRGKRYFKLIGRKLPRGRKPWAIEDQRELEKRLSEKISMVYSSSVK